MEGVKYDEGKRRLSLLPTGPLEEVVRVLEFGANKYGDYNWRNGMNWSRVIDAVLRHIFKWLQREENDEESGLPHLAHAACGLLFLLQYKEDFASLDDRYCEKEED